MQYSFTQDTTGSWKHLSDATSAKDGSTAEVPAANLGCKF